MFKKIVVLAILALGVANAASYSLTLIQPSVVKGTQLKPGEYRVKVDNDKITITNGKLSVETVAKVENGDQKFGATAVRYTNDTVISEIRLGGTKTKLVFSN
jgi:hypothetical protein